MTNYTPIFQSPITFAPGARSVTALSVDDLTGAPILFIQGEAGERLQTRFGQIPAQPGEVIAVEGGFLAWLTPKEFYLFGGSPRADLPPPADLEAPADHLHATDLTAGRAGLKLSGPTGPELLSKICGLDFHDSAFPSGQVKQTSAAKIKTLIARLDEAGTPTYFLHVNRPFGQYFWDILWDAGQEFGLGVPLD